MTTLDANRVVCVEDQDQVTHTMSDQKGQVEAIMKPCRFAGCVIQKYTVRDGILFKNKMMSILET